MQTCPFDDIFAMPRYTYGGMERVNEKRKLLPFLYAFSPIRIRQALVFDRVIGIWRKVAVYVPGVGGGAARGTETAKSK